MVFGPDNEFLWWIHREEAHRVLRNQQADRRCAGRVLRAITLRSPAPIEGKGYHGGNSLRTTYREQLKNGTVIAHKPLRPQDRHLYELAIRENLAA